MKNIDIFRNILIKKIKSYLKTLDKNTDFYSISSHLYFSSQESTLANTKLDFWINKKDNYLKYYYQILKHFISISINEHPIIKKKKIKFDYETIIETWAVKKNFHQNGSLNDRYFNTNSRKNKKILWVVIYLDNELPKKIDKNILLIYRKKKKFPNLFYLFKYICQMLIYSNFNLKKFFHTLSFQSCFAFQNYNLIKEFIFKKKTKVLLFPYEGQPFQNMLISKIRKINKKIKTLGYIHYTHPFQTEIFNRKGSPDKIFTYSLEQLNFFKNLGWNKKNITLIPSLTFKRTIEQKNKLKSKIFLPYKLIDENKILLSLEKFFKIKKKNSLPFFQIAPHPSPYNFKKQQNLEKKIRILIKKNKEKFTSSAEKNLSIVIGLTTSVFIALENGIKVIHISLDPLRDQISTKYWSNIEVKELAKNVNIYKLKKLNSCILINNKGNNLSNFILNK